MVTVYSMESGYVESITCDIGDYVRKGSRIATLSNPELQRELNLLQPLVEAKKKTFERLQSILEKTPALTPVQQVEDAEMEYNSLVAQIAAIEDRIRYLTVTAPFSGIVTDRMIDEGSLVQSGVSNSDAAGIVKIQEINPVRLELPMPESDASLVREGMEVVINFPELPEAEIRRPISRSSKVLDPQSKTMKVQIDIPNADGKLRPGMYAKAFIELQGRDDVLSLPMEAQVIYKDEYFVLTVDDNGIVKRVPIRKGLANNEYFEVLNPEITDSSKVIIVGKSLVKPGHEVNAILKS